MKAFKKKVNSRERNGEALGWPERDAMYNPSVEDRVRRSRSGPETRLQEPPEA